METLYLATEMKAGNGMVATALIPMNLKNPSITKLPWATPRVTNNQGHGLLTLPDPPGGQGLSPFPASRLDGGWAGAGDVGDGGGLVNLLLERGRSPIKCRLRCDPLPFERQVEMGSENGQYPHNSGENDSSV